MNPMTATQSGKSPGLEVAIPSDAERRQNAYSWYIVAVLFAVSVLGYVDRVILSFLVEPIKAALSLSDKQVGLVVGTAFALLYVFGGVFLGKLLDGKRRVAILAACIVVWSFGTLLSGLASGFALLFFARMLVGVGEAGLNPAAVSIISDRFAPDRVQRPLGLFTTGLYVGGGMAMIGGGALLAALAARPHFALPVIGQVEAWRMTFAILSIPGIVVALAVLLTIREKRTEPAVDAAAAAAAPEAAPAGALAFARANARLITLLALSIIAWSMNNYGLLNWYPAMLTRSLGMTSQEVAWTYGPSFLIGGIAGCLSVAPVARMLRVRFGAEMAPFALTMGCMAILSLTTLIGPLMPERTSAIVFAFLNIFVSSMSVTSVFILIVAVAPPRLRGIFTGLYMALVNLTGGAFGSVIVGAITDNVVGTAHLNWSLSIMSAVCGPLAVVLMIGAIRTFQRRGIAAA